MMAEYQRLPAFGDVKQSLADLKSEGHSLYAFSNGAADAVETLLVAADIRGLFDGVVSVDDRKTFKPNPDVYEHLLDTTASSPGNAWLISSNPFDVIGAMAVGMRAAWNSAPAIRASNAVPNISMILGTVLSLYSVALWTFSREQARSHAGVITSSVHVRDAGLPAASCRGACRGRDRDLPALP